ncbi:DUF397 domain-containing protein [Actinokineospora sp.]|uniref:DUF397 domain-containing protein n=1 Tax=Actinokineospora sp. TaxID=1872133 RepID=UPI003D6B0FCD
MAQNWRKSSFSASDANCVEIAWRKSGFSGDANCVEIAWRADTAGIRDSKRPEAGHLTLSAPAYRAFIGQVPRFTVR